MGGGEPLKCHHEKVHEETRFPPKPHWRDLVLICEPKIKLLSKNGTKFPSLVPTGALNWNTSEVLRCPSIQHDTLPHRQMSTSRIEILKGISNFSILFREEWRGSPKPPFAWELEALFGIPAKNKLFPWAFGDLWFWPPYPLQRHLKSFLWLDRASSTKKYEKLPVWPPSFLTEPLAASVLS